MQTRKYKSFAHWYSYHEWLPLAVGLVALLAFVIWRSNPAQPPIDYYLSWVGATRLSHEEEESLTALLRQKGQDQDGDGKITVYIDQYEIDFRDAAETTNTDKLAEYYDANQKLITRLSDGSCYLYLMEDPEQFQYTIGALRYLDGHVPSEEDNYEYVNWEQMCVPFTFDGFKHTAYLARRSLFEEGADYEAAFPGGEAMFQALIHP